MVEGKSIAICYFGDDGQKLLNQSGSYDERTTMRITYVLIPYEKPADTGSGGVFLRASLAGTFILFLAMNLI